MRVGAGVLRDATDSQLLLYNGRMPLREGVVVSLDPHMTPELMVSWEDTSCAVSGGGGHAVTVVVKPANPADGATVAKAKPGERAVHPRWPRL
jgi:hypothetical protein